MNKTFTFTAAAALLLCAASCSQQESLQDELGGQTINLTLEAIRGEETPTKTAVTYNDEYASLESVWSEGDVIYVYSRKSGEQLGILNQTGSIINQNAATSQYPTSYASFSGSITLGTDDKLTDDFAFVYQGAGRNLAVAEGLLSYEMGTSETVSGLNAWDLAYATGKIQGSAAAASCAVSFTNMLAFGYFSTEGLSGEINITNYYGGFTLDVKTGNVAGVSKKFTIPSNEKFYMPLIAGTVNMGSAKVWSTQNEKLGYANVNQSISFTAAAGSYYRLGRNAEVSFGPVKFDQAEWTCYETLKNSIFNVGTEAAPKNVHFTQGNLQYIGSAVNESGDADPYWRVAETQYSYLGTNQGKPSSNDSGSKLPENADTDLFGWGEVAAPFLGSTVGADYQPGITTGNQELPEDANWATKFNSSTTLFIEQGKEYTGIEGEKYIVLSSAEWKNLFANQYWGFATVTKNDGNTVSGLVICPASVTTEEAAKAFLTGTVYKSSANQSGKSSAFNENSIDQATIDANGLLFLPAAGYRNGTSVSNVGSYGLYWASTSSSGATNAYYVYFYPARFYSANSSGRYYGYAVRLASVSEE